MGPLASSEVCRLLYRSIDFPIYLTPAAWLSLIRSMMSFLGGVAMDKEDRYGQARTICNGARLVGFLDSPPIVFWARTEPEHAIPATIV